MILGFLHKATPLRIFFTVEKSPGHFLRENPNVALFTMLVSCCELYRSGADLVCRCHEIRVLRWTVLGGCG